MTNRNTMPDVAVDRMAEADRLAEVLHRNRLHTTGEGGQVFERYCADCLGLADMAVAFFFPLFGGSDGR